MGGQEAGKEVVGLGDWGVVEEGEGGWGGTDAGVVGY